MIYSLNFSFYCFIFYSRDCFCNGNIFSLLLINCSWNIFCLIFNWIIVCNIFSFWNLNFNCLGFHFNDWSLIFFIFHSRFSSNSLLNRLSHYLLDSNRLSYVGLLHNWLDCYRMYNRLCYGSSILNWSIRYWLCICVRISNRLSQRSTIWIVSGVV